MRPGTKPKPVHLRVVSGTAKKASKAALNPKQPKTVRRGLPKAPPYLDEDAKGEWDEVVQELYDCGILSTTDRSILAQYAMAVGNLIKIRRSMDKAAKLHGLKGDYGLIEITSNGNRIQSPLLGASNKAQLLISRFCEQLGMTPSARSRVTALPEEGEGQDPADKYLDG